MKLNKKQKKILFVSVIIVGIIIVSMISLSNPFAITDVEETTIENWKGIDVSIKGSTFSSYTFSSSQTITGSYDIGNYLTLESGMKSSGRYHTGKYSYFIAEMNLPEGVLTMDCSVYSIASEPANWDPNSIWSECGIEGYGSVRVEVPPVSGANHEKSQLKYMEFVIDKPTKITAYVYTASQSSSDSQASIKLGFEEKEKEKETYFYRLQNNECTEILLLPSEKTENDYSTLEECKNEIIPPEQESNIVFIIFSILGIILFIGFLIWLYLFTKKRR